LPDAAFNVAVELVVVKTSALKFAMPKTAGATIGELVSVAPLAVIVIYPAKSISQLLLESVAATATVGSGLPIIQSTGC
jgi:hypothetical protein